MQWTTVPILPCVSLDETMRFWKALGFEQTYYQQRPYPYGVVERDGGGIHYIAIKGIEPEAVYSSCIIVVTDLQHVHDEFSEGFRQYMGKVAQRGFPRISRMRTGQTRFTLTDPSGNTVIFVKADSQDQDDETYHQPERDDLTRLQRAIANAIRFRDYKRDDVAAAKVLEVALKRITDESTIDIARALLLGIELADILEEPSQRQTYLAQLKTIDLTSEEKNIVKHKLIIGDEIIELFDNLAK